MSVNPSIEQMPAWISAGERKVVPMSEIGEAFDKTFGEVAQAAASAGATITGPAYACYFGMPTDTVDVEIGFGIDKVVDLPGLLVSEHPESKAIVGTHVGPYDQLQQSYAELMPWIEQQRVQLTHHMFEFYDSEPGEDPSTTVTRIVFPIVE